jgi:hypothetical protein
MLTVEGIFRDGQVRLLEEVSTVAESKVLVTFVESTDLDLRVLGIDEPAAAELRAKFSTFEDWNDPTMDIYNDYDNAKPS